MEGKLIQFLFINLLFLPLIANSVLYYTYFWQLKEYRIDRMMDFLRTRTGKKRIFTWFLIIKCLFVVVLIVTSTILSFVEQFEAYKNSFYFYFVFTSLLLAVVEGFDIVNRLLHRRFYRPDITTKSSLIVVLTIILTSLLSVMHLFYAKISIEAIVFDWSVIYLITPFLNALIVLLFIPVTIVLKGIILKLAKRKIMKMKNLKIIAITGSYGKSTTKEFLAHILSNRFNVLKTPGNINTEIGVAKIILKKLMSNHDVFIVEAGAYKIGEIKKIAEMVSPQIAIITAVKDSHLSLFGSIENIKSGKFELIQGLKENGTAIFNADNEGASELSQRAKDLNIGKIITFGLSAPLKAARSVAAQSTNRICNEDFESYSASSYSCERCNIDCKNLEGRLGGFNILKAEEITEDINGITFKIKGVQFHLPVAGKHNVYNFMAAAAAATELGMDLDEMVEQAKTAKTREHTLTVIKPSDSLVLIDDTYNANPDGVMSALNYLSLYKDTQKIIVFPGMLELGSKAEEEHLKVVEQICKICDHAIFISEDYRSMIERKLKELKFVNYCYIVGNQEKLYKHLIKISQKTPTSILFISRGSEQALKKLSKK